MKIDRETKKQKDGETEKQKGKQAESKKTKRLREKKANRQIYRETETVSRTGRVSGKVATFLLYLCQPTVDPGYHNPPGGRC